MGQNRKMSELCWKQAQLAQTGALGYAGINERDTASQRAADVANARTKSQENIFGGKNISSNIALHENQIKSLSDQNSQLAAKIPGGIGGTIQSLIGRNADISQYLQDPRYGSIVGQMKQNQQNINFHQQVLQPLYRSQGMIPPSVLDNSDLNNVNPNPQTSGTGDNSIATTLPGFGGF